MDTIKKREEEATSKETLKDIEDSEKSSNTTSDDADGPSPDGAFDEHDDAHDADPM